MRHVAPRVSLISPVYRRCLVHPICRSENAVRQSFVSGGCYPKIRSAVGAASNHDVINVAPGTYKEDVASRPPLLL